MNKSIFSFFLIPFFLFSENELPLSNRDGGSISIVNGCVNVISGDFLESSSDATLKGPESLEFQRHYCSSSYFNGNVWDHFHHNFESYIEGYYPSDTGKVEIVYRDTEGRKTSYSGPSLMGKSSTVLKFRSHLGEGYTNIGKGVISSRNDSKNSFIENHKNHPGYILKSENGAKLSFTASRKVSERDDEFSLGLSKEEKSNGNKLHYNYQGLNLIEVKATDKNERITYNSIYLKPTRDKELKRNPHYQIDLSDGRKILYKLQKYAVWRGSGKEERYRIRKVIKPDNPFVEYKWGKEPLNADLMIKKSSPENRFLKIHYFQKTNYTHFKNRRVKYLLAPLGSDQTAVVAYEFDYKEHKDKYGVFEWGNTTVFDATRHMSVYHYGKDFRINKIDKFKGTVNQGLYSRENFFWDPEGRLDCHTLQSETGEVQAARVFKYDPKGNLLSDSFFGNLQGGETHITFDEKKNRPKQEGCNSWTVDYRYSQDGRGLLLEEKEPHGKSIEYTYEKGRDLVTSKFVLDNGKILIREFYEYDHFGLTNCYIKDDGTTRDKNDLRDVSDRKITRTENQMEVPFGLPRIISDYYLDLKTRSEVLIKKIVNHYNAFGYLTAQEVYDANNTLSYVEDYQVNTHGKPTLEKNAIGETRVKTYNQNDELSCEFLPVQNYSKNYTHDFSGRVIKEEEKHGDGTVFTTTHRYNVLHQCVETINPFEVKTAYEYDDFGRLTKILSPAYKDLFGQTHQAVTKNEYDIFGHLVKIIDPKGIETTIKYTSRGQKREVKSAFGVEIFEYNDEGTLRKSVEKNGLTTYYKHDKLGRLLKKQTYSKSGLFLSATSSCYNSFHKISDTDALGHTTYYSYYPSGELKSVIKNDSRVEYSYDALQRIISEKTFVSNSCFKNKILAYDVLNRVVEERLEDEKGVLLLKKQFIYDLFGNKSEIIEERASGLSVSKTIFNSKNQPVKIIDPKGNEQNFFYRFDALNKQGQKVLEITEVNQLGIQTITQMSIFGKAETIIKKNPLGVVIAEKEISYDVMGNVTSTLEKAISDGAIVREVLTKWVYNEHNLLRFLIEAAGTKEQKITEFCYNSEGLLETTIKPDGERIEQTYDDFNRIKTYKSSNHSFSYCYEYDLNGNLIKSTDLIRQEHTLRKYNELGFMVEETLQTGFKIHYEYDLIGRPLFVFLQDGSSIAYEYDALYLRKVKRISKTGEEIFSHDYLSYDLTGSLLEEKNSFSKAITAYQYDLNGALTGIDSQNFNEKIVYDEMNRLIAFEIKKTPHDLKNVFFYDELNQLKSEKGFVNHDYTFDSLNNCIKKDEKPQEVNCLNQLLKSKDNIFTYDLNGNRKSDEQKNYEYDTLDRLIKVKKENQEIFYTYDSFNRRLSKEVKDLNGKLLNQTHYLYFDQNEVGLLDNQGNLKEFRVLGTGKGAEIGATVLIEKENRVFFPVHDHNGNILSLVDGKSLEIVESYRYSSFGEETIFANDKEIEKEEALNPWRFSSKRIDEETGFANFGRRYYDSLTAKWLSPDPIGFEGGPNLYAYVMNSPLNHIDLYGLEVYSRNGKSLKARLFNSPRKGFVSRVKREFYRELNRIIDYAERGLQGEDLSSEKLFYDDEYEKGFKEQSRNIDLSCYNRTQLPNCKIGFINGIRNLVKDAILSTIKASDLAGGVEVCLSYNQTHGFYRDVLEAAKNLYGNVATKPVRVLHESWNNFFENSIDGHYLQICHSQGTIHVRNALKDYPEEFRNRIHVLAIAPAGYIPKNLCGSVTHYISERDLVPLFDRSGRKACRDTTIVLRPHKDAPWFDHDFGSPTYENIIRQELKDFIQNYGELK